MRYHAMAKHFIFESAMSRIPTHEDGERLEKGKPFTEAELQKFIEALDAELERMRQKLIEQRIIEG